MTLVAHTEVPRQIMPLTHSAQVSAITDTPRETSEHTFARHRPHHTHHTPQVGTHRLACSLGPCTQVHGQGSPAIRAGKGWRGRRELAPRCSATQLGASHARAWSDTPCR